jgi:hypothetical protein
MTSNEVFLSVGTPATAEQEAFVRAVEDRLRRAGLTPFTVGRNVFSHEPPIKAVKQLMEKSAGAVVVALERSFFSGGLENRGGRHESSLSNVKLATPWNQIEAAMAYANGLPLLIILESGLKDEGLLEAGYGCFIHTVEPTPAVLTTRAFDEILANWQSAIQSRAEPHFAVGQTPHTLLEGLIPALQATGDMQAIV